MKIHHLLFLFLTMAAAAQAAAPKKPHEPEPSVGAHMHHGIKVFHATLREAGHEWHKGLHHVLHELHLVSPHPARHHHRHHHNSAADKS